jgi:peptide-methionine (R)-S-oxide reductase
MKRNFWFLFSILSLPFFGCQNKTENSMSNSKEVPAQKVALSDTSSENPYYSRTDTSSLLNVSNADWKKVLSPEVYAVSREKDTEYAFSGKYWDFTGKGTYFCAACGNALFKSDAKFASSCGWPSFFEQLRPKSVTYEEDNSHGMQRIEVLCGRCNGHLGHLFDDGPAPTHKRYCMNSIVLDFEPEK